jgi:hypothetical protein
MFSAFDKLAIEAMSTRISNLILCAHGPLWRLLRRHLEYNEKGICGRVD